MVDTTKMLLTFFSESVSDLGDDKDQIIFTSMHPKDIEGAKKAQINLYLYHLSEDPNLRNQDVRANPDASYLPNLNYHYLITIHGTEDESESLVLLEKVWELFFKNPCIESQSDQAMLDIVMDNNSLEFLTNIWQALQTPLRPGLNYIVRKRAI
jgi:hypothetical protein